MNPRHPKEPINLATTFGVGSNRAEKELFNLAISSCCLADVVLVSNYESGDLIMRWFGCRECGNALERETLLYPQVTDRPAQIAIVQCYDHPRYLAICSPAADCSDCWSIYNSRWDLAPDNRTPRSKLKGKK